MRYTLKQFQAQYPTDDACLEAVFKKRFGDIKHCPKCAVIGATFHRIKKRQCYACAHCGYQLHPLADTIFRKTTTPLTSWFYAIYLFSVAKNGVSAKELERHLGVTYKTAWRMATQIRKLMEQDNDKLDGDVEIDEAYMGGVRPKSERLTRKPIVFGMVERGGKVRAVKVMSAGARVLLPKIEEGIETGTSIYSDGLRAYRTLNKRGYSHTTVNHSALEYVRGQAHTNTLEGFWSQLKRSIDGTYHAVSPKYLQAYLDQFVFYYNHRDATAGLVLLDRALKPV